MSEGEKDNNAQIETNQNREENETPKIQETTNDSAIKLKKSGKSRRKTGKINASDDESSQEIISSSMYFEIDQQEVLNQINQIADQIESTKNKLNIESFLTEPLSNIKQVQEEIEKNSTISRDEAKNFIISLKQILKQVSDSWNPPLTDSVREDLTQIRNELNNTITELRGQEVALGEFKELEPDSLNQYILDVSSKINDPNEFFNAVTNASHLVINRDVGLLEQGLKDLSEYINNAEVPYDTFVNQMYYAFLYYQVAAINSSYFGRKEFEANVKTFFETQPDQLRDVCFDLLDHFYAIMLKANPRSIEKDHDTIVKDLYYSLGSPAKMDLARTYYYLKTYSLNSRHMLFFKGTLNDIKSCFHGQNDPTKIDFNEAMEILKNDVSAGFLNYSKTLPSKFKSEPLKIVESQYIPSIDEQSYPHYYYSDSLVLNSLIPNGYEFKYREPSTPDYDDLAYVQIANELTLPQWEINRNQTYIHVPSVGQSSRYISNSSHSLNVKFNEIGRVYQSNFTKEVNKPPSAPKIAKLSYFKFTISTLKIFDSDVDGLTGMVYVLDGTSGQPTSEPLYFQYNNKTISFLNKSNKEAIFPLSDTKNQYLILRLLHQQSIDVSQFNKFIRDPSKNVAILQSPFNFAVSAFPLFDKNETFVEATSFPERFSLIAIAPALASDTNVISQLTTATTQTLPITTEISIKQLDTLPTQGISRSFLSSDDETLLLSSTKPDKYSADPIITLSNIRFTFKNPPKGTYVYFTAFYTDNEENIKNPKGFPYMLSYSTKEPQSQYLSTTINTNKTCQFPDIIRILIKGELPKTAHIIFHFYTSTSDAQNYQAKVYKAAVFPLFTSEGVPIRSDANIEVPSFEFKEVQPNKYLYPGKISSQSKVLFSVSIPSIYAPPPQLKELLSKKPGDNVSKIDISKLNKDIKVDSFVPTVARYLTIMGPNNTLSFVNYLAQFNQTTIAPIFLQYCYRIFTPLRISDDFPLRFFSSYSTTILPYLKIDNTADNVLQLIYFLKTSQYFMHIAIVTILTLKKEKKPIEGKLLEDIIKFSKSISILISSMSNLAKSTEVNKSYSLYMHIISPIIGYDNSLPIINDHLTRFNSDVIAPFDLTPLFPPPPEVKPKHPPPEPPIPKPDVVSEDIITRGLSLKLAFIKTFANTNNLLANCGYSQSKNVKIFENLFDSLTLSMTKAKHLIPEYVYLLAEFVRTIEHYPEISMKCANVYIPYLTYAINYANAEEFKNYQLYQHYLVPILFVLHTAEKNSLYAYYKGLLCTRSKDEKKRFIEFLETLIVHVLTPNPDVANPCAPIDISECANSEEEYKKLQEVATISKDINYVIYNELTVRILDFVADYYYRAKSIDITDKQAEAFSSLFIRLLGYHQLQSNFDDTMLTISRFVDNYYSKIYFNHTESYDKLVYLALNLVSRNLRAARASGVAMTIHLMYIDYQTTENIIASMHYFYSNLVKAIFECPKYRVSVYKSLLDRLKLFITSYRYEEFVEFFMQHYSQARKIYNASAAMRSSNKSPELRVKSMHRIADQLYGYPLLRLRWLREIVNNNKKSTFYAQAFEGQVQVVALIDKMIRLKNEEHIPDELNYSFVEQTSEENNIDINHCKPNLTHLLLKDLDPEDDVFNVKGLIDNLNGAIKLGKAAGLPWEVRECYYLFINIYESKRDITELRKKAVKLGDVYNVIYNRQDNYNKYNMGSNLAQSSSGLLSTNISSNTSAPVSATSSQALLSANASASFAPVSNGEDSDTYQTPPPNSVNPISTPLYFYLIEWLRHGSIEKRIIYTSTIGDLKKFTEFLNNPAESRFDYGANAAAYQSIYEAESKETNGIFVFPVIPEEDASFTNKIFKFVHDVHLEPNNSKDPVHKRYIFTTMKPHPNSNITAKVKKSEVKEYNRIDDLQLTVNESIQNMEKHRKIALNSLPSQQTYERWQKVRPPLPVMPLSRAINDAVTGYDLALPSIKDAKKKFNDKANLNTISKLARQWVDEIEASLRVLTTITNQDVLNLQKNTENLRVLRERAESANSELFKTRKILVNPITFRKDPLLYFRDYEEF